MDVRFCERRDHSREALDARAKDLDQRSARSRERAWPRVFFLDRRLHGCRQAENVRLAENCVKSGARSVPYGRERTDDSELGVHALDCGYFDNPNCFSTKGKNWDGSRARACDRLNSALNEGLFSPRSNWPM